MMRWGRRKSSPSPSSSSSSSRPSSFISHVFPLSWLSKFKQMRINSESSSGSLKHKGNNPNSLSVASSHYASCGHGGSFRGGEDDVLKAEFYNLEDDDRKHGRKEGTLKFEKKDTEERKILRDTEIPLEIDDDEYNREKELEKLRRTFERKAQRVLQERLLKLEKEADYNKDVVQLESPRTICTPKTLSFIPSVISKNSSLGSLNEGGLFSKPSLEKTEREKHLKKSEMMKARKTKHKSSKVRIYSPRMASNKVEICKIKALEDVKKAKLKMKKEKERMLEVETEALDSFAVVKCSFSPEKDFRDSMVEMITELQLNQPEEMEELLACYLTLNSDEYHDLIVKVFREVWFEMNKDILGIT